MNRWHLVRAGVVGIATSIVLFFVLGPARHCSQTCQLPPPQPGKIYACALTLIGWLRGSGTGPRFHAGPGSPANSSGALIAATAPGVQLGALLHALAPSRVSSVAASLALASSTEGLAVGGGSDQRCGRVVELTS